MTKKKAKINHNTRLLCMNGEICNPTGVGHHALCRHHKPTKAQLAKIKAVKREQPESYPDYLRRVGDDYVEYGAKFIAKDYEESADLIDDLVKEIKDLWTSLNLLRPTTNDERDHVTKLLKRVTR